MMAQALISFLICKAPLFYSDVFGKQSYCDGRRPCLIDLSVTVFGEGSMAVYRALVDSESEKSLRSLVVL